MGAVIYTCTVLAQGLVQEPLYISQATDEILAGPTSDETRRGDDDDVIVVLLRQETITGQ